jgi:hypothetical protein
MTLFAALFTMSSCDRETFGYDEGDAKGYLRLTLNVDNETTGAKTRAVDNVPSADDFAVAIYKGSNSNPSSSFDKFGQISNAIGLSVGQYTVKASYGGLETEGFDSPYFSGESSFSIADGEEKEVKISCALGNAKVNILKTDAFNTYFSDYNTEVTGKTTVTYSKEETRGSYFRPGKIDVYVNVTRQTGTTAKLFVRSFTAEAKHEYNITMDIDAGTSTLNIAFDDNISNAEDVNINVSDAALSAKAPEISPIGFTNGSTLTLGEGTSTPGNLRAYINAESGLSDCVMKTSSVSLLAKGWPEEVHLGSLSASEKSTLESLGLSIKGLGTNKDKIAIVDFTEVVPNIEYNESNNVSVFTLQAIDKNNRTNENEFALRIATTATEFSADADVTVSKGTRQIPVNVVFGGDAEKNITAQYKSFGQWTNTTFAVQSQNGSNYVLLVQMPYDIDEDDQIRLVNGSRTLYVNISTNAPVYSITAKEADIWSDSAVLSFVYDGTDNTIDNFLSGKTISLQLQNESDGSWSTLKTTKSTSVSLTGLEAGKTYTVRAKATYGTETNTSKAFSFTTEATTQLPNASFENWYSVERKNGKWYEYYPWSNSDSNTKGWDTMNQYTFQLNGDYGYTSNSGTISTTDSNSGNAALIRTMGWGPYGTSGNVTNASSSKPCMNKTPGELYLGSFNSSTMAPDYGMEFTSRPKSLSFYYKYTPCNDDNLVVEIIVENRSNGTVTQLGSGSFTSGNAVNSYTLKTVDVNYTNTTLKATHLRVLFKSGTIGWTNEKHTGESYWLEVPSTWNLSDGKYVASQLYIDDVTLGY